MGLKYKLFAIDMDGTLLDSKSDLVEPNISALRRYKEEGGIVVLNSGRMAAAIKSYYDQLGFRGPLIACNGALIMDEAGDIFYRRPLPAEKAQKVVDVICERGWLANYYIEGELFNPDPTAPLSQLYVRRTSSPMQAAPDLHIFDGREPEKILILGNPDEIKQRYQEFSGLWGGEMYITISEPEYVEFMHPLVSKGEALSEVARHYGVPFEECACMGDNYNDLPMFRLCGFTLAPANSRETVLQQADARLASNDEGAVAEAIEQYLMD